jgi:hypothetical protein
MVYEKFLFGLDQAQLNKAIDIAQQYLNAVHTAQLQLRQPAGRNWSNIAIDAIVDALAKIFLRWDRDPQLGQTQQVLSPPKPGVYKYTFACTGDASEYNATYTVTLS